MADRVLIIDADMRSRTVLGRALRAAMMVTEAAVSGEDGIERIAQAEYDLVLLDIDLPGIDGFHVIQTVRQRGSRVPMVVVSSHSEDYEQLYALDLGADDYVTKPFSPAELTARIDALYRRIGGAAEADPEVIVHEPFTLNLRNRTLEKSGRRIKLTQVEFAILQLFMQNPGRALSREDILTSVWGRDYDGELKIVDVNIRRLRIKIEDNTANPTYITTVWGYGYKWGL